MVRELNPFGGIYLSHNIVLNSLMKHRQLKIAHWKNLDKLVALCHKHKIMFQHVNVGHASQKGKRVKCGGLGFFSILLYIFRIGIS